MLSHILILVAGFVRVFAAGFQSRNVNTGRRKAAMLTSFLIAVSEGTVIYQLALAPTWVSLLEYGCIGAFAIWCAMEAHERMFSPFQQPT